jgi:hypothetical protein
MLLATFAVGDRVSYGIVQDRGVIDAGARLGAGLPDLVAVLRAGAVDALRQLSRTASVDYALDDV